MRMNTVSTFPITRLRRLRHHEKIRALIRATRLSREDVILPLFIKAGIQEKQPITAMPEHYQLSLKALAEEIRVIRDLGLPGVILFGIPHQKDAVGSGAFQTEGIVQQAIPLIKQIAPELLVMTDVCCCEYTDHGHCGPITQIKGQWSVDNDATLELLIRQAVSHAKAGADIIAPSGMMDGMVAAIRRGLDAAGFQHLPILSYSCKFASAFYGPFREAAESTPQFGDRRGYQMDGANAAEALREAEQDMAEGADMLMVKPAGAYLDVIYRLKQLYPGVPLGAYQVSGEYAMIKAAAANGWLDEKQTALESLLAIKRAGADFILTYFAKDVVKWL